MLPGRPREHVALTREWPLDAVRIARPNPTDTRCTMTRCLERGRTRLGPSGGTGRTKGTGENEAS